MIDLPDDAIQKNWQVTRRLNYVSIEHTYGGIATALTSGSTYSITLTPEGAALMAIEIQQALIAMLIEKRKELDE